MKTIIEVKAAIYDQMAIIEQAQANIRALNQRLMQLMQEAQAPTPAPVPEAEPRG